MTRRDILGRAIKTAVGVYASPYLAFSDETTPPLALFNYADVQLAPSPLKRQFVENHQLLLNLSEDDLLRPFRIREGLSGPGRDLGGWYDTYAFAPGATYGQWVSALARFYAASGDQATLAKVNRLVQGYASTIDPSGKFYVANRFPSYTYDKLICGLIDAHALAKAPAALETLARATDAASAHLPEKAMARQETPVLGHEDFTRHCWDESYTLPENLFLAWQRTHNPRYLQMAKRYLFDEEYFNPLARGENVLPGRHAYSHVNALSSAAAAYLVLGDEKYLRAASNGFTMVEEQSFATGGWGPDEHFISPGSGKLADSLTTTHASFETPCGSYAHFKITRYLLRITRDSRYGDSMERVMYNTVLGAKPIQADGSSFYYSDYNFQGHKFFHPDKWPCCSGTLPQIAADYGINSYFRDQRGVYVNLYVPSTVTWKQAGGGQYSIEQVTDYPYSSQIRLNLTASVPSTFSIFLRIPQWADGASISVNGMRDSQMVSVGRFAEIRRQWKAGDRIELDLPLKMRLKEIDAQHPDTVALLSGPLVLMLLTTDVPAQLSRAALLAAEASSSSSHTWAAGALTFKPFMDIDDERYTTYVRVPSS